jgi:hypothetical protein
MMNERIKNFLVVCGMPNEQIFEILEDRAQTQYMQNFAELIIEDIIKQLPEDCQVEDGQHLYWVLKDRYGVK